MFCKISKRTDEPYDIYAGKLADYLISKLYYRKIAIINNQPYLYHDGVFKLDEDGKELKESIKYLIVEELIEPARIKRVYELIIMNRAITRKFEDMNQFPVEWVCFRNGMYNPVTGELLVHSPDYLCTNMIPHDFKPDAVYKDSVCERFVRGLIPDEEDREMFLRYAGICFTRDTRLQKFFVIVGLPGTGKSVLLNMLTRCIGRANISNISLQDLNKRFYPTLLYGKLTNINADLPRTALETTDAIKKIVGEDDVIGEIKGGAIFSFRSYAKLLFSTNEFPQMLDEKSNAFFRRILCVEVTEEPEYIENLQAGLEESLDGFIHECMRALGDFYKGGAQPIDSANSKMMVKQLYREADSVQAFLDSFENWLEGEKIERKEMYTAYVAYCGNEGHRPLNKSGFYKNLRGKGVREMKIKGENYFKKLPPSFPLGGKITPLAVPDDIPFDD